jgi:hypothetical protein
MIKQWRIKSAGHVASMRSVRNAYNILVESLDGRDHLQDLGVDGKVILEWILEK